jgi:hypothetical protein
MFHALQWRRLSAPRIAHGFHTDGHQALPNDRNGKRGILATFQNCTLETFQDT